MIRRVYGICFLCILFVFACNGCTSARVEDIPPKEAEVEENSNPNVATYTNDKPNIDGKIDECWSKVRKLQVNNHYLQIEDSKKAQNTGYVSVMWDEQNLYLLGVVQDADVTKLDRINFWISETFIESSEGFKYPFSANPKYGMYYTCINPDGELFLYSSTEGRPVDFSKIEGYQCKGSTSEDGYIVEVLIPKQSDAIWKEGHVLGFDVSIDTYYTGETLRGKWPTEEDGEYHELYCNWNGAGAYWEDASQLGKLEFIK